MPRADIAWNLDVFGDLIATATFAGPTSELSIIAEATIEHGAPDGRYMRSSPRPTLIPFTYALDDTIDLAALVQPGWLTPGGEPVGIWASSFVMMAGAPPCLYSRVSTRACSTPLPTGSATRGAPSLLPRR